MNVFYRHTPLGSESHWHMRSPWTWNPKFSDNKKSESGGFQVFPTIPQNRQWNTWWNFMWNSLSYFLFSIILHWLASTFPEPYTPDCLLCTLTILSYAPFAFKQTPLKPPHPSSAWCFDAWVASLSALMVGGVLRRHRASDLLSTSPTESTPWCCHHVEVSWG